MSMGGYHSALPEVTLTEPMVSGTVFPTFVTGGAWAMGDTAKRLARKDIVLSTKVEFPEQKKLERGNLLWQYPNL